MKKTITEEKVETQEESHKEYLLGLLKTLQDLNIRSVGDLENLIARAE